MIGPFNAFYENVGRQNSKKKLQRIYFYDAVPNIHIFTIFTIEFIFVKLTRLIKLVTKNWLLILVNDFGHDFAVTLYTNFCVGFDDKILLKP